MDKDNIFEEMQTELLLSLKDKAVDYTDIEISDEMLKQIWQSLIDEEMIITQRDLDTNADSHRFNTVKDKIEKILGGKG